MLKNTDLMRFILGIIKYNIDCVVNVKIGYKTDNFSLNVYLTKEMWLRYEFTFDKKKEEEEENSEDLHPHFRDIDTTDIYIILCVCV